MRPDLEIIQQWVQPGHHVLDLGCGDGTLLDFLQRERGASGFGLEINPDHITACMGRGVAVIEQNLDTQGLGNFEDGSFDIVLMTQALQAVRRPDRVLDEMLRVGKEGIVTFPNFAHWVNRVQLTLGGSMPMSRTLPNPWYSTPNIHLCTVSDFEKLCNERGIHILQRTMINQAGDCNFGNYLLPNLLGRTALYRFERR